MGNKLQQIVKFIGSLPDNVKVHMSRKPISKLKRIPQGQSGMKPNGLWYDCDKHWIYWAKREMPDWVEETNYIYLVKLKKSKMLQLKSKQDILDFTAQYKEDEEWSIDWKSVASKYSGIEICPYQGGLRMDRRTSWYYTWDVASGCVWNTSATELEFVGKWDEETKEVIPQNEIIASELVRVAREVISLNCKDFEDDYVTLLKQYHTMSGPGKRQVKKTIEEMEKRLRDECWEEKPTKKSPIEYLRGRGDGARDPDDLYYRSGPRKEDYVFFYIKGKLIVEHRDTHSTIFWRIFDELPALMGPDFSEVAEWAGEYGLPTNARELKNVWGKKSLGSLVTKGDFYEFGEDVFDTLRNSTRLIQGRVRDGEISFWSPIGQSKMKALAKKMPTEIHTIHDWL